MAVLVTNFKSHGRPEVLLWPSTVPLRLTASTEPIHGLLRPHRRFPIITSGSDDLSPSDAIVGLTLLSSPRLLVSLSLPQLPAEEGDQAVSVTLYPVQLATPECFNVFLNGGEDHHLVEFRTGGHLLLLNARDRIIVVTVGVKQREIACFNDRFQVHKNTRFIFVVTYPYCALAGCRASNRMVGTTHA